MKIFCLMAIVFNISAQSLVLVHTGSKPPSYIYSCIGQIRKFNESLDLYLIVDGIHDNNILRKNLSAYNVIIICTESLKRTVHHSYFLQQTNLEGGFWLKTCERFFLIEELMEKLNLQDVIHIENDVMIYFNCAEYMDLFRSYKNIAAVFDNDDRCIASIIFFKTKDSITFLNNFIAKHSERGLYDMQIIALFKKNHDTSYINNLPIIMPEYNNICSLRSQIGMTTKNTEQYSCNIEKFNSIFDGAALGQYLGGIDPIHAWYGICFVNESCLFDVSKLMFIWQLDEKGRRIPYVDFQDKLFKINNLHIHSKNLRLFES